MLGSDYPHNIKIIRPAIVSSTPPYTKGTPVDVWEGECCSQVGSTYDRSNVAESTHTIYTELLSMELKSGDEVEITLKTGWTPIYGEIVQFESSELWEDGDKTYGTTIWVKETKN